MGDPDPKQAALLKSRATHLDGLGVRGVSFHEFFFQPGNQWRDRIQEEQRVGLSKVQQATLRSNKIRPLATGEDAELVKAYNDAEEIVLQKVRASTKFELEIQGIVDDQELQAKKKA